MKTTVNFSDFVDAFLEIRPDNFSYEGLEVLWSYFEEYEDSIGDEIELDVIAICCDFSEDTVEQIAESYSIDLSECGGDYYEISEAVRSYLEDQGAFVGETASGFVYRCF